MIASGHHHPPAREFLKEDIAGGREVGSGARVSFAKPTKDDVAYDLYCGLGTIGLTMAPNALSVWGIEVSEESVACAIENAELNGIANAAFFAGEVGRSLEELRDRAGNPDVVVVDPPRAGLSGKALRMIGRLAPSRVVYVS